MSRTPTRLSTGFGCSSRTRYSKSPIAPGAELPAEVDGKARRRRAPLLLQAEAVALRRLRTDRDRARRDGRSRTTAPGTRDRSCSARAGADRRCASTRDRRSRQPSPGAARRRRRDPSATISAVARGQAAVHVHVRPGPERRAVRKCRLTRVVLHRDVGQRPIPGTSAFVELHRFLQDHQHDPRRKPPARGIRRRRGVAPGKVLVVELDRRPGSSARSW